MASSLLWDAPRLYQMIKRQGIRSAKNQFFLNVAKVNDSHIKEAIQVEDFLRDIWNMSLTDYFCKWDVNHKMYTQYADQTKQLNRQPLVYSLFNFNRVVQSAFATDQDGPAQFMLAHSKFGEKFQHIINEANNGLLFNQYLPSQGNGYKIKGKMTRRTLRAEHHKMDERGREVKNSKPEKDYYVVDTVTRGGRLLYVIDDWSDESKTGLAFVDSHFVKPKSYRPLEPHEEY